MCKLWKERYCLFALGIAKEFLGKPLDEQENPDAADCRRAYFKEFHSHLALAISPKENHIQGPKDNDTKGYANRPKNFLE